MSPLEQVREIAREEARRAVSDLAAREARYGTVTVTSPLTVRFWGGDPTSDDGTEEVDPNADVTLAVDDTVALMKVGARWYVVGKVS